MSGGFEVAWAAALDELELDVARAEDLLRGIHLSAETPEDWHSAWAPPRVVGTLPDAYVERATLLLARQRRVAAELAGRAVQAAQQASAAQRLRASARPASVPVYVDQAV